MKFLGQQKQVRRSSGMRRLLVFWIDTNASWGTTVSILSVRQNVRGNYLLRKMQ
jgi:hypothetical protein